ncbi:MAG: hypothetical protein D6820_03585, partial [Lentisphaerae bacterium]
MPQRSITGLFGNMRDGLPPQTNARPRIKGGRAKKERNLPLNMLNYRLVMILLSLLWMPAGWNARYCLPDRIGKLGDLQSRGIIFFPKRDRLLDFDDPGILRLLRSNGGRLDLNASYWLTPPSSLRWDTRPGSSLFLPLHTLVDKDRKIARKYPLILSLGIFLEQPPPADDSPQLNLYLRDPKGNAILEHPIWLHRQGWNMLAVSLDIPQGTPLAEAELRYRHGPQQLSLYFDNFLIYWANIGNQLPPHSRGMTSPRSPFASQKRYPLDPTLRNQTGLAAIIEKIRRRVIPPLPPIQKLPPQRIAHLLSETKYFFHHRQGPFAFGKPPIYYHRAVPGDNRTDSSSYFIYQDHSRFCQLIRELGRAWEAVRDPAQKEKLGEAVLDLLRLAVTTSGVPNPWYNGRGLAEGAFRARNLLVKEGLNEGVRRLLMNQYGSNTILYLPHHWEDPPQPEELHWSTRPVNPAPFTKWRKCEFLWHSTADSLNTEGQSLMISILIGSDIQRISADLFQLKSWLENIALNDAPYTNGTLKPDGSWFHHHGNRFDNYGWGGAWRGATEYVYWLSATPFALNKETHQRIKRMARIHFAFMDSTGYVGPADNQNVVGSQGFRNLALAPVPGSTLTYDPEMAAFWLAFSRDKSLRYFKRDAEFFRK